MTYVLTDNILVSGRTSSSSTCYRRFLPRSERGECDPLDRYRSISGRCNNLRRPDWGSAGSTLRRLLPNAYEDGVGVPRGGHNPSTLPSGRFISQKNHPDNDVPDTRFTHMVMQFGQFLDHDLTLTHKEGKMAMLSGAPTKNLTERRRRIRLLMGF